MSNKNAFEVKLRSIMRALEEPLRSLKNQLFDPEELMEYFERFASIRTSLKTQYASVFADLPDRELPVLVEPKENSGKGFIKRRYLELLFDDCRECADILSGIKGDNFIAASTPKVVQQVRSGNEIFISHASKDKPIVKSFVEQILRLGLEVKAEHIFCTSLEGMDIKNGTDFRNQIQSALDSAKLIILIITPNYKSSEVCQNEMGAAWASGKRVIPLIVEPITYKSVGVLMEPLQIPRISDTTALSKIRDDVIQELGIASTKTDMWDTAKAGFLAELQGKINEVNFSKAFSEKEVEQVLTENKKLTDQAGLAAKRLTEIQAKYEALSQEKGVSATEKIEEKFGDREPIERFKKLTKEVVRTLSPLSRVVQAIVICDFFKAHYDPQYRDYDSDLDSAIRRKQISYDERNFSVNSENREVQSIRSALERLQKFVHSDSDEKFPELYEKIYNSPLEVDNQDFWEEHFGLNVPE